MYATSGQIHPYRLPLHRLSRVQPRQQGAPKQRVTIACQFCRQRKIRCSGFESSPAGRCANCSRANQECVFTLGSSRTQELVPAYVVYPDTGGTMGELVVYPYGAHGQPFNKYGGYPQPPSSGARPGQQPAPPPARPPDVRYKQLKGYESQRNLNTEPRPQPSHRMVPGNRSYIHPLTRGIGGENQTRRPPNEHPPPPPYFLNAHVDPYLPPTWPSPSSFRAPGYLQNVPPSEEKNYYAPCPSSSRELTRSHTGYQSLDSSSQLRQPVYPLMEYPPPSLEASGLSPSCQNTCTIPFMPRADTIGQSRRHSYGRNGRTATDGNMLDRLMPRLGL